MPSDPFHNRPDELALITPLVGSSCLELGNKKNGQHLYKTFFVERGFRHVSVDWNGQDGALKRDLREPLSLGTFDIVTNIGTSEHVNEQEPVWRNLVEACHVGSVLICTTPYPGDWTWHGWFHPHDSFYADLAIHNGFYIQRLYVSGVEPRRMWFARLMRHSLTDFTMPAKETMHFNRWAMR